MKRVVELPRFAYAPIEPGQVLGTVRYELDGKTVAAVPLAAGGRVGGTAGGAIVVAENRRLVCGVVFVARPDPGRKEQIEKTIWKGWNKTYGKRC